MAELADVALKKPQRDLIDLPATADRLGVSVRYVRRLVAERRIPFFKLGHLLRFDSAEIDVWLEQAKVGEIGSATTRTRRR